MSDWKFEADPNSKSYSLTYKGDEVAIADCLPEIIVNGQSIKPDQSWTMGTGENEIRWALESKWEISLSLVAEGRKLSLATNWKNLSGESVSVDWLNPLSGGELISTIRFDRILNNGKDMVGFSSLYDVANNYESYSVVGLTDSQGNNALTAGFTRLETAFYTFITDFKAEGRHTLTCRCDREGIELSAEDSLEISPLVLEAGSSLAGLMRSYAESVAAILGKRNPGKAPAGWCSWYYYYDTLTEKDLYDNMDALQEMKDELQVDFVQIDDGWNLESKTSEKVWGDWHAGGLFPGGMKKAADDIKARDFVPGLWLAPFSVDKVSQFAKENPHLLVKDEETGEPKDYWGTYGLDLSHPGSIEFLKETFTRVFDEWGFEYIKIDFLIHAIFPGDRYDNSKTTAQLFREGITAIREVAKDRYMLGCGSAMGPAIGLFDGMRIGYDVSSRWYVPMGDWPLGNCNIKTSAVQHVWRYWMHETWWQNDPDCLLVRDYAPEPEFENFRRHAPDYVDSPAYGLTENEASCWAQMVWMTGGLAMIGENMKELEGPRLDLLKSSLPVHTGKVRWFDHYGDPHQPVLVSEEGPLMIGVFNLTDDDMELELDSTNLGLGEEWNFTERLSGEKFFGKGVSVRFPTLPARSGKIWILQE
ncbi:glycoside hydrolase family 36 protein [Pelagicoccus mobilis]|uniref:Alpha-galactosidase n=1 Tax=Pelagicoccus mobilis TaxID=415221 RepID=A0A934VL64_9BACT|nr:glycoside hydrolase family 36 protein [Pelagicoccus mobilis]MBK1877431.1 alpha-galactosidase [Pelagicoccus mobilis]